MKKIAFPLIFVALAFSCIEQPTNVRPPSGSSGTGDIPDDGYDTAKEIFDRDIYPIFASRCTPCHSQGFNAAPIWLGAEPSSSYARIEAYSKPLIAYPENSWFRLKGEHTGPALEQYEDLLIYDWLIAEVNERGLVGDEYYGAESGAGGGGSGGAGGSGGGASGGTAVTLFEALEQFGQCMTMADWQSTGMINLPNQMTALGACKTCHFAGMGGNFLSGDSALTFEKNRLFPFVLKIAVGTVDDNGAFLDLVPAKRHIDKGTESQTCDQEPCHPAFLLPPAMQSGVENFFLLSYARWKQGACVP